MRISDWSSDVCSSDLNRGPALADRRRLAPRRFGCRQSQHQGSRQAGTARPGCSREAAGDGLRLHGGRTRRAPGRKEDPRPREAADGEEPARILSTQIGRASCRARVWWYVSIPVVARSLETQKPNYTYLNTTNNRTHK